MPKTFDPESRAPLLSPRMGYSSTSPERSYCTQEFIKIDNLVIDNTIAHSSNFTQTITIESDDLKLVITGYDDDKFKRALYNLFGVLSVGLLFLLGKWFPGLTVWFSGKLTSLSSAPWVMVQNQYGQKTKAKVELRKYDGDFNDLFPGKVKKSTYIYLFMVNIEF